MCFVYVVLWFGERCIGKKQVDGQQRYKHLLSSIGNRPLYGMRKTYIRKEVEREGSKMVSVAKCSCQCTLLSD